MKSVKISNNISVLPMRCFAECTALTDVTIPDSVIEITYSVFCDCSALKTVRFGANVEYTNFGAFRRCTSLERVVLPDSLTFINSWTFEGCSSLKSVVIPASVTEIYTEVFDNCPELTIYGKADTVAEQYAADNGIAFVAMSDREEQISEFVERMYTVVLDRASEEEGFQVWKNWIMSGEHTAAEMTNAFINSSEFTLKNLSDDEYLDVLYRAVMGRESDNDGVASWKEVLSNGVSRNFVLSYFITSSEFTDISTSYGMTPGTLTLTENRDQNYGVTSFVQRFYTKVLNRNAEVEGINAWTGYILNKECTPAQAAKIFVFSDEANALDRDDTEFIYMLYRTFMGRECESAESLNIWINYLGEHSREALFEQFAGSKEFAAIIASYGL